jgi:hypothetical protein
LLSILSRHFMMASRFFVAKIHFGRREIIDPWLRLSLDVT